MAYIGKQPGLVSDSSELGFNNTASGLAAETIEEAVNELSVEKQDVLTEGAFVDGDKAKLDLIEDGATADQTGAEIKAAYEAEADTNAYTDAEKTLVDVSTELDTTATTLPAAVNELHGQITTLENRELTHKVDGTVTPTVTDDADAGFEVGSLWIDTVADEAYRCADATAGAAVWVNTTLTADELSALLISYDNTVSGLAATTVKDAIDEVASEKADQATTYTKIESDNLLDLKQDIAALQGVTRKGSSTLELDLVNSINMKSGVGSVTHDAPSTSTYINRYGVLETAGVDEAGFNEKGMRFDAESTNTFLYSNNPSGYEDVDNTWELTDNVTLTTGVSHIDGTNNAVKLINDDGLTGYLSADSATITDDTIFTWSAIVEYADVQYLKLSHGNFSSHETRGSVTFDLVNGTVTNEVTSIGSNTISGYIKSLDNNRFLCELRGGKTIESGAVGVHLYFYLASNDIGATYTGDGTSGTIVHSAQCEALPYATSYIPTTDTPVTRTQAVTSFPTKNNMPDISKGAGLFMEFTLDNDDISTQYLLSNYLSSSNSFNVRIDIGNDLSVFQETGNVTDYAFDIVDVGGLAGETIKLCVAFREDGSGIDAYIKGVLQASYEGTINMNYALLDKPTYLGKISPMSINTALTGYIKSIEWVDYVPTETEIRLRQGA
jgi:hypothetical protein